MTDSMVSYEQKNLTFKTINTGETANNTYNNVSGILGSLYNATVNRNYSVYHLIHKGQPANVHDVSSVTMVTSLVGVMVTMVTMASGQTFAMTINTKNYR